MKRGRGFTLVEILVVAGCIVLLMGPILSILRSGSRTSLQGMLQIDTTLEARRIIKQFHTDLKQACFSNDQDVLTIGFSNLLKESGKLPDLSYSFLCFPLHGRMEEAVPASLSGKAKRLLSRVTYKLEKQADPEKPFLRLTREEKYHPEHAEGDRYADGVHRRVLSERVNFLQIKPIEIQTFGKKQYYFWITLQLTDTIGRADRKSMSPGVPISERSSGLLVADFFDVVYPEFFNAFWNQEGINRNWHTVTVAP